MKSLVVKLAGNVQNDSLPFFGKIRIQATGSSSTTKEESYVLCKSSSMFKVTKVNGEIIASASPINGQYELINTFLDKTLNEILLVDGGINYLQFEGMCSLVNDEDLLLEGYNLKYISIKGTIRDTIIGKLTKLEGVGTFSLGMRLTGSCETVVNLQRENGRTAGSIGGSWNLLGLTFGGVNVAVENNECLLNWDENDMWIKSGNTIWVLAGISTTKKDEFINAGYDIVVKG